MGEYDSFYAAMDSALPSTDYSLGSGLYGGISEPNWFDNLVMDATDPSANWGAGIGGDVTYSDPSFWDSLSNLSAKDWASLGLGGLSLIGNLYENRQNRNLSKNALKLQERTLASGENEDIAKTAALLNMIQARQGIATSPESYEAVRRGSPLSAIANRPIIDVGGRMGRVPVNAATGGHVGALRLVQGGTGGQDDAVNARLSDGEYVFDADAVAALGDGNTEAGAAKLDKMRENIRAHKRSASPKKIPPKAKSLEQYLRGGK